jgi:hypothetical protein
MSGNGCLLLTVRDGTKERGPGNTLQSFSRKVLMATFRENGSRLRDRLAANNLAWLKRFALSLLKQIDDKESIAMRRRMAGWNPEYLSQVLGLSMS